MADLSKQLEAEVLAAYEAGQPLNIVGGGSKGFLGRETAERAEHQVLNLSEHSGIVSYQPVELVLTVRAGTALSEIEAALDEHGQMLAFEPPHFGETDTIGGTLACNLSGPARPWGGSVRDHVLGIRLINGMGEHLRFGGQVMKNVAGYDVSRLQAGAMGTLGVITEISLKVMPKPAHTVTLTQAIGADEAITLMNKRAGVAKPLTAACWVDGLMYLRLAGARAAVEATQTQWGGDVLENAEAFWSKLRDQQHAFFAADEPLWRFSVKPTAALAELEGAQLLDWGGAQRWYRGKARPGLMQLIATEAGGQVSLFRGGDRRDEVAHTQPEVLQRIQIQLKQRFDPKGIFNPGRVYGWL